MDRIHETGIIGSLRWWYEAIMRGLGGYACDPTEHTCTFDAEKYRESTAQDERQRLRDAGLCDACQVFGATGWRRRFRLEIRALEGEIDITDGMFPSGRIHPHGRNSYRTGGWLLRGGYHGKLELKFIGDPQVLWCEILPILLFMEKWGALGAKTSLGYGVFEILSINGYRKDSDQCWREFLLNKKDFAPFECQQYSSQIGQWWWREETSNINPYQGILSALTSMFFARVRFAPCDSNWWKQFPEVQWLKQGNIPQDEAIWTGQNQQPKGPYIIPNPFPFSRLQYWVMCHNTFPIAPILRTRLRYGPHSVCGRSGESNWCKFVFGTVQGRKRIQSKIRISWAYQINGQEWEIRLWGWLPEEQQHRQRASFLKNLRQVLGVNSPNARQWHDAQNGQLWQNLDLPNVQIYWFEKQDRENVKYFLNTLLKTNCR